MEEEFEQVDLVNAMINSEARDHLLGALLTGYGKSMPMLVASLLLPPGIECEHATCFLYLILSFTGSTIVVHNSSFQMMRYSSLHSLSVVFIS